MKKPTNHFIVGWARRIEKLRHQSSNVDQVSIDEKTMNNDEISGEKLFPKVQFQNGRSAFANTWPISDIFIHLQDCQSCISGNETRWHFLFGPGDGNPFIFDLGWLACWSAVWLSWRDFEFWVMIIYFESARKKRPEIAPRNGQKQNLKETNLSSEFR